MSSNSVATIDTRFTVTRIKVQTVSVADLPPNAYMAAILHREAKNISPAARQTFTALANGETVTRAALVNAIIEGLHADATRAGTSSARRVLIDPLLNLWRALNTTTLEV